jgi:hypothetical protein
VSEAGRVIRAIELAIFIGALSVAGLVMAAIAWSGEAPYRDLAAANGVTQVTFATVVPEGGTYRTDLNGMVLMHGRWSSYVTGAASAPPRFDPPLFTDDEYAHMADVRRVFEVAKFAVPVSLIVIVIRMQRARQRGGRAMWGLVRDGGVAAAIVLAAVGVVAAVAFEALFLAFHYVFFPQGNFLFPPTSNLIRLYPDWYWQGISLRVGLSFIAFALALAGVAQLRLRAAK